MLTKEYHNKIIHLPFRGAPTTVAAVVQSVMDSQKHYCVRQLADFFLKDVTERDYISEPLAILYSVKVYTKYRRDPTTVEMVTAPYIVCKKILNGETPALDCDDLAALICALCMSIGCQTSLITLAFKHMHFNGERQYSHIAAQIRDPRGGGLIVLDPVAGPKTFSMLKNAVAAKVWPIG